MPGRRAGIALLLTAALAGCGGSDSGLSDGQQNGLLAQLQAARASAAARDVAGTEAALRKFRVSVTQLQRSGALTDAQARVLRLGAQRVLARVQQDNPPAPAPAPVQTQTMPAPAPQPPPPGQAKKKHDEKPGKGHGKGEGD